jgi:hypothetical protein
VKCDRHGICIGDYSTLRVSAHLYQEIEAWLVGCHAWKFMTQIVTVCRSVGTIYRVAGFLASLFRDIKDYVFFITKIWCIGCDGYVQRSSYNCYGNHFPSHWHSIRSEVIFGFEHSVITTFN